jgi:Zn-dependent protease
MFLSLKIARLFGINVQIHWTFWLLPLWVVFAWLNGPRILPLWMTLLLIAVLFVCVVLHEFGHALTARQFGIRTRNITLTPLGGIAQLERMSHKPWEEFCIAVAGPLVNVVLAVLFGAPLIFSYGIDPKVTETAIWTFGFVLVWMNILMVLFNMLPAFPMDGGRVLRAILSSFMGVLDGTRAAVTVGTVVAILMGIVGVAVLGNIWLLFIALFVIWAGRQELWALEMEEQQRHEDDGDHAAALYVPRSHVIVHVWDSRRGAWVRQSDV